MDRRIKLHEILCELLGSKNVYYQPPESVKMQYDAIRYSLADIDTRFANDKRYKNMKCYDVIFISRRPDPEALYKILDLPYASLSKPYVTDNLYHYPITLYH